MISYWKLALAIAAGQYVYQFALTLTSEAMYRLIMWKTKDKREAMMQDMFRKHAAARAEAERDIIIEQHQKATVS